MRQNNFRSTPYYKYLIIIMDQILHDSGSNASNSKHFTKDQFLGDQQRQIPQRPFLIRPIQETNSTKIISTSTIPQRQIPHRPFSIRPIQETNSTKIISTSTIPQTQFHIDKFHKDHFQKYQSERQILQRLFPQRPFLQR